ncbi:RagB/SusD family nutrient uptake outer membrane protein [Chryseobacterium pennae]|uniref:RagB/SusD family nutrient uptake outer membrane protein n=1 Tax=Chryseobacterium pennae TaxID=2258962 RepID=A0A3D9C8K5_9FLAO|nr:RagB/SusD family nutrient uptake outer membrane protein [Chryseobacterium pennae]REC61832.1 RagB/SusD family nutrient uptake outer membrane protein [Chryseobacterium pennae]
MKKIHYIILFIAMFCTAGCEKLIEVDIPNNQIDKETVFKDVQTANAALAALYAEVYKRSPIAGADLETYLSAYTDELEDYTSVASDSRDIFLNQQTDTNSIVYNVWAAAYKHIYTANSIMEGVTASPSIGNTDKNRLRGEALLIRSIMFFYLNQLYGDIPYPETTDYNINNTINKSPSAQVLSNIERDLIRVSELLQTDYRDIERIYPNKMVAKFLLAKVYIAKLEWNKAETILMEIRLSPLYQLETDINKVFQKAGKHILWQLKPHNNASLQQATAYYFTSSAPNTYAISAPLINSFQSNDLRLQNWIAPVTFNGKTYYRLEKYKNRNNTNTNEYAIIFRLEEVYLLLAEVLTHENKIAEALPYVNAIKQRAQLTPLAYPINKDSLLDEILLEDKREFFAETGHRFLDLKRNGKLNILLSVKPNWKTFHDFWPVPQKEILLNANLKPQNTGY